VRGGFVIQSAGAFVSESVASEIAEALLGFGATSVFGCIVIPVRETFVCGPDTWLKMPVCHF